MYSLRTAGNIAIDDVVLENKITLVKNQVMGNFQILLYPNPVTDKIFIKNINEPVQIKIKNILGQELESFITQKNELKEINTTKLSSGLYFVNIIDKENNFKILKFLKR